VCRRVFISFKHPLILVASLTIQTIPAFLILYYFGDNIWMTYILFLIFLGGLLIIFIYLAALIPNEIFQVKTFKTAIVVIMIVVVFLIRKTTTIIITTNNNELLIRMFRHNFIKRLFPLILLYLLGGLFRVIIVCEKSKSPLKTNTYEYSKTPPYLKNCQCCPSRPGSPYQYYSFLKFRLTTRNLSNDSDFHRNFSSNTL